jgi:hypothetical protein
MAAHHLDNMFGNGQTQTRPAEFARGAFFGLFERVKQTRLLFRGNTYARIPDFNFKGT